MATTYARALLAACLLLAVAASVAAQSEVRPTGTFSNLHFHAEGGDLLGTEVKIVLTRNGYQAALQIAEGGPSEIMVADVTVQHKTIRFSIPVYRTRFLGHS